MPTQPRDQPVPVKKGSTGPARRAPATESTAAKPSQEQLNERQQRMRLKRRKGPELGAGEESRARPETEQHVPPTECDDEGEEQGR